MRALGPTAFGCGPEVPELAGADGPASPPSSVVKSFSAYDVPAHFLASDTFDDIIGVGPVVAVIGGVVGGIGGILSITRR
jgi:hypothetical protein